jgi:predicted transcriptional regulator
LSTQVSFKHLSTKDDHGPDTPISASLEFTLRLARAQATLVRRLDQVLGGYHGISFNDFMLLHYLNRAPGGRLRRVDLAERLALTASGVTRSLLPLEKIGLVERQQDPRDARVAMLPSPAPAAKWSATPSPWPSRSARTCCAAVRRRCSTT